RAIGAALPALVGRRPEHRRRFCGLSQAVTRGIEPLPGGRTRARLSSLLAGTKCRSLAADGVGGNWLEADNSSNAVIAGQRRGNFCADRPTVPAKYIRRGNIGAHHVYRTVEHEARHERERVFAVESIDKIAIVDFELRHRLYRSFESGERHHRRPDRALRSTVRHHQETGEPGPGEYCFLSGRGRYPRRG